MFKSEDDVPREDIGRNVIRWALRAITAIAVVALLVAALEPTNRAQNVKDILALLLPVIGAWVGTVLAFYFGRENYVAAAQNSEKLLALTLEQKLESSKASEAMRPIAKIVALRADDDTQVKLKDDMLDKMSDSKSRLPVLGSNDVARYIVHRSMIDRFIADRAMKGDPIAGLTLADLVGDADIKAMVTSFAVIAPDDKLTLAKHKIDADPRCLDVFVTEGGNRAKPVMGWITNNAMLELSKA